MTRIHPKHYVIVAAMIAASLSFAIGIGASYVLAKGDSEGGAGSPKDGCRVCGRAYHNTPRGKEVMIIGADADVSSGGGGGGAYGGGAAAGGNGGEGKVAGGRQP